MSIGPLLIPYERRFSKHCAPWIGGGRLEETGGVSEIVFLGRVPHLDGWHVEALPERDCPSSSVTPGQEPGCIADSGASYTSPRGTKRAISDSSHKVHTVHAFVQAARILTAPFNGQSHSPCPASGACNEPHAPSSSPLLLYLSQHTIP